MYTLSPFLNDDAFTPTDYTLVNHSSTFVAFHGEMNIWDGPEDFIHFADFSFVLEIHRSVEVGNLGASLPRSGDHHFVGRLAQKVAFRLVHDKTKLYAL